jgi:hypothetical protein
VVLAALKGATLGGLLTLAVASGLQTTDAAGSGPRPAERDADPAQQVVSRAVTDHQCSYGGFGDDAVPASALIRDAHGELRQVSFEVGWAVYNGKRPGTLIAVCLDRTRGNELVRVSDQP